MTCNGNNEITITYFSDVNCVTLDANQPSTVQLSPYNEISGVFADNSFTCGNEVAYTCINTDQVFKQPRLGVGTCHGGCGTTDMNGQFIFEPCESFTVDPVPPSGGLLVCEPWFDPSTGLFDYATQMQCIGSAVSVVFYADNQCTIPDPLAESGTFETPYTEQLGALAGKCLFRLFFPSHTHTHMVL
jgi:hypothetical protein